MNADPIPAKEPAAEPTKVLLVDDRATDLNKLLSAIGQLQAIPEEERSAVQRANLRNAKRIVNMARARGYIRQGQSARPKPQLVPGEQAGFKMEYPGVCSLGNIVVKKVKADGRVYALASPKAMKRGDIVTIKGATFGVYRAGDGYSVGLQLLTAEDLPAWEESLKERVCCERRWISEEIEIGGPAPAPTGPSASQLARRQRKENRARGRMERKLKAAAAKAPAGSIGAAMLHSGGY